MIILFIPLFVRANESGYHEDGVSSIFTERCIEIEENKSQRNKEKRDTYIAVMAGNGKADVEGDQDMGFRSFEFRFGKWINNRMRVDFIHTNEGHPENNHRDGFAVQYIYRQPMTTYFEIEAGIGPYFSMNTTREESGNELNDKNWGALASLAAITRFPGLVGENIHLRIQYNYINMKEAFNSDEVLVGMGFEVESQPDRSKGNIGLEMGVMGSVFQTNHFNTEKALGGEIELKIHKGNMAYSVSGIFEGDDCLVNRNGVAARVWYEIPVGEKWSISAGAGPYFSKNELDGKGEQVNAIIGMQLKREIGNTSVSAFIRFNRIVDFNNNDRDKADIGFSYAIE